MAQNDGHRFLSFLQKRINKERMCEEEKEEENDYMIKKKISF